MNVGSGRARFRDLVLLGSASILEIGVSVGGRPCAGADIVAENTGAVLTSPPCSEAMRTIRRVQRCTRL